MAMSRKEFCAHLMKTMKDVIEEELGENATEEEKQQALCGMLNLLSAQMFHAKMK